VTPVRHLWLLLVSVALIAAACGGSDGDAATNEPVGESGGGPDFSGTTIDGTELVSADYAGQDVILWFWAPW